jgi:hypothetical protein
MPLAEGLAMEAGGAEPTGVAAGEADMPESMPEPSMPEPSSMDPSSVVPVSPPVAPVSVEPVSVELSVEPALGSWAATPRARRRRARAVERRSPSIVSGGWVGSGE